jgi:hypothetical protein
MIQIQSYRNDAPRTGSAFTNGGPIPARAERAALPPTPAPTATPSALTLILDSEPAWPSECERLALINALPSDLPSVGEQYLLEAFYLVPRRG